MIYFGTSRVGKIDTFKPILLEPLVVSIVIDHQMTIIQVWIGKNFIDDVLFYSGFGINIITKKLWI